ncbi:MAG: redoxin family protein [Zavarzinella sp.]
MLHESTSIYRSHKRFCTEANITNMQTLSDATNHSFGTSYGVLLEGLAIPLLARAVFVVDKSNKVTYVEYVSEVTSEPDYAPAVAALKAAA